MSTEFAATVEFSVKGYVADVKTFRAETLADVKELIKRDVDKFREEVQETVDDYGDYRCYCPEFANGYPTADFEGEEAVEITLLTVIEEVVEIKTVEVTYDDDRHVELRKSLNCD